MLVKATDKYEKLNLKDIELNRIPKEGEEWEVSEERYEVLKGNNKYNTTFAEAVEDFKKMADAMQQTGIQTDVKKAKTEKETKTETKKKTTRKKK